MALTKEFLSKLDELWERRTSSIRSLIVKRRGRPWGFTKEFREEKMSNLQDLATRILLRQGALAEFKEVVYQSNRNRLSRIESRNLDQILLWVEKLGTSPIVYSFWRGKKCFYVGKAANFKARLNQYISAKSSYLRAGTTIKTFSVKRKGQLGKAECLAIHLFKPVHNRVKAAHRRWGKACPICEAHDKISEDLGLLFKMK